MIEANEQTGEAQPSSEGKALPVPAHGTYGYLPQQPSSGSSPEERVMGRATLLIRKGDGADRTYELRKESNDGFGVIRHQAVTGGFVQDLSWVSTFGSDGDSACNWSEPIKVLPLELERMTWSGRATCDEEDESGTRGISYEASSLGVVEIVVHGSVRRALKVTRSERHELQGDHCEEMESEGEELIDVEFGVPLEMTYVESMSTCDQRVTVGPITRSWRIAPEHLR